MNSEVIGELKRVGLKPKWMTGESVYRISRTPSGQWFACSQNGYHTIDERDYLPLAALPNLRGVLGDFESTDEDLKRVGGRVFISTTRVFRK